MRKQLLFFTFLLLALMVVPSVLAQVGVSPFEKIGDVFGKISDFGSLEWLLGNTGEGRLVGFLRILIAIVTYSLIYMGITMLNDKVSSLEIPKGTAVTISVVMSIVSAIFMPGVVLMAIGAAYSSAIAFILLGSVIGAGLYLLYGTDTESKVMALSKLLGVLFLWWLIFNMEDAIVNSGYVALGPGSGFDHWFNFLSPYLITMLVLSLIIYLFKVFSLGSSDSDSYSSSGSSSSGWFGKLLDKNPFKKDRDLDISDKLSDKGRGGDLLDDDKGDDKDDGTRRSIEGGDKVEEKLTLDEFKLIKETHEGLEKSFSEFLNLEAEFKNAEKFGVDKLDKEIDNVINKIDSLVKKPLEEADQLAKKIGRVAKKQKRKIRHLDRHETKEEEMIWAIEGVFKNKTDELLKKGVKKLKEHLENLKKNPTSKDKYNLNNLLYSKNKFNALSRGLKKLHSDLVAMFELEEKLDKEIRSAEGKK